MKSAKVQKSEPAKTVDTARRAKSPGPRDRCDASNTRDIARSMYEQGASLEEIATATKRNLHTIAGWIGGWRSIEKEELTREQIEASRVKLIANYLTHGLTLKHCADWMGLPESEIERLAQLALRHPNYRPPDKILMNPYVTRKV